MSRAIKTFGKTERVIPVYSPPTFCLQIGDKYFNLKIFPYGRKLNVIYEHGLEKRP